MSDVLGRWAKLAKRTLVAIGKSLVGLAALFLLSEFVIFRYLLPAPDLPANDFVDGVIKLKPSQRGESWGENGTRIAFSANEQGWNSGHLRYSLERHPGIHRIAIIGDSFVDARQVDYDKSLAEQLERMLGPDQYEVYRFGIPAAPLSQYLQILRREVAGYRPDLVVFVLIHNDFDESYNVNLGSYPLCFLRLRIAGDRVEEIQPQEYKKPWFQWIRASATYRYLVDGRGLSIQGIKNVINYYRFREVYQANIAVERLEDRVVNDELVTDYVFRKTKELAESNNFRLLMIMDGDRRSLYRGLDSDELYASGALRLNAMVARVAARHGMPFIDLHPVFAADYRVHGLRFDSKSDAHWNERGHEVAARAIYEYLKRAHLDLGG